MISVVIPVYNAALYLEETFRSVLRQTIDPQQLELIVVDDGSQDNSLAIVRDTLSTQPIQHRILVTSNGGPSRARNLGWQQARGEWVQFLDADDLLLPQKIEFQRQRLPNDDRIAVVYSEWQRLSCVGGQWQPSGAVECPTLQSDVLDVVKPGNFLQLGAALFRRAWLEQVSGFNEASWLIEDVELLINIAIAGGQFQFARAGKPLFFYRQHAASLSRRDSREFIRACLRTAGLVDDWVQQQPAVPPESVQTLIRLYNFVARNTYREDPESFEAAYRALRRLSPDGRYHPQEPKHLALLSRLLGYKGAEEIAYWYRKSKALFNTLS